ncbi:MAG: lipid A export permease/ATP-binding protein MsbA [Aquificaceae bacterium]|nr:MAG: lipid A export permease/ATP-binding protein MsbA [Aquificaceae bacterium]
MSSSKTASNKPANGIADGFSIYKRLASYALNYRLFLFFAFCGLLINAATQPMFAAYIKPLLDGTFMDKNPETIRWAPFALLFIFLLRGISGFISGYFLSLVGRNVVTKIRGQIFGHLLHLPLNYYDKNNSGQLITLLIFQVEQLATAATKGLKVLVQDTATVIGLLALMLYYSWELTLVVFMTGPVIAVIISYVSKRFRRFSRQIQDSVGDVTQISSEALSSPREIRIFDGIADEKKRFKAVNERNRRSFMKRTVTELLSMPVVHFIVAMALSIIIYMATNDGLIERFTPGTFMAYMSAMMLLLDPVKRLTQINSTLQSGIAAGESIFAVLDESAEKDTGTQLIKNVKGDIVFDHVTFRYETDLKDVIKNISFKVKAGQKIALVGQSGSGKTTLVNMLPRFYNYYKGDILLDGIPITDIKLSNLREQFAYVGQDITLFNDTVRNNIAYGKMKNSTDKQIKQAVIAAHALEFIEALPQGFDTLVGENGTLLSGGQKQRIAIARAILADASILILDEATSALDTQSEKSIQGALEKLLKGRTTFIIAHRLSTIESADNIIVMEEGTVVEMGTHQELLDKGAAYAKLHQLQFDQAPSN